MQRAKRWCCEIAHAYLVIYIVVIILAGTTGKIHLVSLSMSYRIAKHRSAFLEIPLDYAASSI